MGLVLGVGGMLAGVLALMLSQGLPGSRETGEGRQQRFRHTPRTQSDVSHAQSHMVMPLPHDPHRFVGELIEVSKTQGADTALEQAMKLPYKERESAVFYLLMGLVKDQPAVVSNWVLDSGLADNKIEIILRDLVKRWEPHDSCLNWIEKELSGERLINFRGLALRKIAEKAPGDALQRISSMPAGSTRSRAVAMVVGGWADSDLPAAKEYVLKNLTGEEFASALIELFPKWVERDIDGARAYLKKSDNPSMKALVPMVVYDALAKDPEQAMSWAIGLPERFREEGVRSGIFKWVDLSVDSAVEYVDGLAGEPRRSASLALGAAWADTDPEAAANWASRQANVPLARELTKEVLFRWCRTSPEAATDWVLELPDGAVRQEATILLDKISNSNNGRIPPGFEDIAERFFNDRRFAVNKRFCVECNKVHPQ